MSNMETAIIAGYARTPYCKISGQLSGWSAVQLGAHAAKAALVSAGVSANSVDQVVAGQVLQAGAGQNPARQTAVAAGVPALIPSITLNSVCLSGADAVLQAVRLIQLGEAQVVLVVGQESMSNAPHAWVGSRNGRKYGSVNLIDTLEIDGLTDAFSGESMGLATEKSTAALGTSRASQDEFALLSHQRATAAREWVAGEISPIVISGRGGDTTITDDDGVRADTSLETLTKLRPAFTADGSITAANSSQLTDGAAAIVLVSSSFAAAHGVSGLGRILSTAKVAGPDYSLNLQPSNAISAALAKLGKTPSDLAQVEINEAFAAVGVASAEALGVGLERVNVDGGAIAIGHPIGSSGTRIVGHLARNLQKLGTGSIGAIGICGGGGQGVGIVVEAI
jgi:acetyl-CoA C-acetyltransferase